MGSIFGGGGGGGGGGSSSGTQVQIAREAPEVESRKLALYDEAAALAKQPISVPAYQVAGPTALEQAGFQQAGTTGVGAPTTTAGIGSVLGAQQAAGQQLNIGQFMNPYQRFVTDEITRQAQIAQNQAAAQAVQAGAFGGSRQGVQAAEIERARQANIGQALQQGYGQALGAAERERALQAQTGLQAGQQLGALGAQQQMMQQADIQSLLQAGGVQRALGQQALEAQRQTSLAQQYEPYQRVEFLKNIMTNLPTTQSAVTATTAPGSNPLAQAAGAGLGAYAAYNIARKKEGGMIDKEELKVNGKGIKGFFLGGESKVEPATTRDRQLAYMAVPLAAELLSAKPGRRGFTEALGAGLKGSAGVGLKIAELESKKPKAVTTLSPAAVKAAGLTEGTIAQMDSSGKINIDKEPSEKELEKRQETVANYKLISDIDRQYKDLGKPVGAWYNFDPDRMAAAAGAPFGSEYSKKFSTFEADVERFTAMFNKAISGATISEQEVERLKKITPQMNDSEVKFEGKINAMKRYLEDAQKIQKSKGLGSLSKAIEYQDKAGVSINDYLSGGSVPRYSVVDGDVIEIGD